MKYMLLIVGDESRYDEWSEQDSRAQMQRWIDYTEDLAKAGALVAGEGLQRSTTATTMRLDGGERLLTDGPYIETKEQLGGFYVIDCKDLDEALDWASRLPSVVDGGVVEVRPVMVTDASADAAREEAGQGATS